MRKYLNEYGTYTRRILCDNPSTNLTVGKWYDVLDGDKDFFIIWDDVCVQSYSRNFFKTERQIRKEKLNKIYETT